MAVSLVFGGLISTILTLIVVPLGCISAGKALCVDGDGNSIVPPDFDPDKKPPAHVSDSSDDDSDGSFFGTFKGVLSTVFGVVITVTGLLVSGVKGLFGLVFNRSNKDNDDWTPSPPKSKKVSRKDDDEWVPSPRKPRKAQKEIESAIDKSEVIAKLKTTTKPKPKATAKPKPTAEPETKKFKPKRRGIRLKKDI